MTTRWLDVEVGTDDIELNTLPSNLATIDLHNDNDYKLLLGHLGREENKEDTKLKIFKGAMQVSDLILPDLPLGVVAFYTNESTPRSIPVLAVAFGSAVYLYRNLKLFYKFFLPSIEWNVVEINIWKQLVNPNNHNSESISNLADSLQSLPPNLLSLQTKHFMQLNPEQQLEFLEQTSELPILKIPELTCITTLKVHSVDRYSVSCLVVGTEDGDIIFLDPQTFTQMHQTKVCEVKKTPYQMVATGLFSVDYRIIISTREKSICLLKRGAEQGRILFNTDSHIIAFDVLTADNSVVVICVDNTMTSYSKKGKKQWCLNFEHRPVAMTLLPIVHLGTVLIGVALSSGHVQFYDGNAQVDSMYIRDIVSVMKFGQLGQEEHVLMIVTMTGNLMLKILKRTADFSAHATRVETAQSQVPAGQRPWLIPKKSKLFLEQTLREKENAISIHESFQRDLNRLRLTAAKTVLESYRSSDNSIGAGALEAVRLSAEVEGLGPVFRVVMIITNTSSEKAVIGLSVLFHVHTSNYKVSNPFMKVPLLAPGCTLRLPTKVEEVFTEWRPDLELRDVTGRGGESTQLKVLLVKDGRRAPALAATVLMPPTDPLMLPYSQMEQMESHDQFVS